MMESAIPPSYSEATTRDHWPLVAEYIASSDLCSACLVSRQWHQIFASWLWGNPAGHFGTENDRVYIALTRFRRSLPLARLQVRELTHTLCLPPALSEIHDGPKAEWLRDILEQLPNLQSLLVSGLPFFDHASLLALRKPGTHRAPEDPAVAASFLLFPLRLLIATQCDNATAAGLSEALLHWQNLVFLDLSNTTAAKDSTVLSTLRFMQGLQVLKLQNTGLRDDDVEVLADAIQLRVRSLDISDNRITDSSVRTLLEKCFQSIKDVQAERNSRREREHAEGNWHPGETGSHHHALEDVRGDDLDERVLRSLTKSVVERLLIEDMPRTGITHLRIANTLVTVEGICSLIRSGNLHVLDAAGVDTAKALGRPRTRSSLSRTPLDLKLPGVEKLSPVLEEHAAKNLTFLRINHGLMTEPAAAKDDILSPVELSGDTSAQSHFELNGDQEVWRYELDPADAGRVELAAPAPIYELDAAPRYELAAEPVKNAISSSSRRAKGDLCRREDEPLKNEGPAFAPEVIVNYVDGSLDANGTQACEPHRAPSSHTEDDHEHPILTATGFNTPSPLHSPAPSWHVRDEHLANDSALAPLPQGTLSPPRKFEHPKDPVAVQIAKLSGRRQQLRHGIRDATRGLLPGSLPALETLVLTEVPNRDEPNGKIISALKKFISDCALESYLASQQAALEYPNLYVRGKPRSMHQSHRCRELFALRTLVLEMAPEHHYPPSLLQSSAYGRMSSEGGSPHPYSPASPTSSQFNPWTSRQQQQRSTTEDPDADLFMQVSQNDFSFFEDEECGLPVREPGRHIFRSDLEQKTVVLAPEMPDEIVASPPPPLTPLRADTLSMTDSRAQIGSIQTMQQRRFSGASFHEGQPRAGGANNATNTGIGGPVPLAAAAGKDVITELAKWRRERKTAADSANAGGGFVEGFWKGEIKIIRPDKKKLGGQQADWYGNYFFAGGVYR